MIIVSMIKRYWENHWQYIIKGMSVWLMGCCVIFITLCILLICLIWQNGDNHFKTYLYEKEHPSWKSE